MSTLRQALQRETWNDRDGEAVLTVDGAILAFRAWLEAEGLVVVPRELTEEMLDAALSAPHPDGKRTIGSVLAAEYRAMIAAAPDALAPDSVEDEA